MPRCYSVNPGMKMLCEIGDNQGYLLEVDEIEN
jgi:hypothetical protein